MTHLIAITFLTSYCNYSSINASVALILKYRRFIVNFLLFTDRISQIYDVRLIILL